MPIFPRRVPVDSSPFLEFWIFKRFIEIKRSPGFSFFPASSKCLPLLDRYLLDRDIPFFGNEGTSGLIFVSLLDLAIAFPFTAELQMVDVGFHFR